MKTLVLDATYLCYRAFHALGELSYEGVETTVPFGFFQEVESLREQFKSKRFVFCFDRSGSKRREMYPDYKGQKARKERTPDERRARTSLQRQMCRLATDYLPKMGFRNIFHQPGYEADDFIASVCLGPHPFTDDIIIVGCDSDLYQLLRHKRYSLGKTSGKRYDYDISIWNPLTKKLLTYEWFVGKFGIDPMQWVDVKAIAGCDSDNVKGIKGVGEKTAARFLAGTLPTHHKTYESIIRGNDIWQRNLPLVKLPLEGTPWPYLEEDEVSKAKWRKVTDGLGMRSLRERVPLSRE